MNEKRVRSVRERVEADFVQRGAKDAATKASRLMDRAVNIASGARVQGKPTETTGDPKKHREEVRMEVDPALLEAAQRDLNKLRDRERGRRSFAFSDSAAVRDVFRQLRDSRR